MSTPAADRVVFVMTDTQRQDMLGCYANTGLKTPCLDRLAAEGVRFARAYTCQPVCGPARSALFTGTFPHSNGSWGNTMPIGDTVLTVGQRLQRAGVHTGYIGKWHLDGGDYFGMGRCPDGWDPDYWYDMRNYLDELDADARYRSRQPETIEDDVPPEFTFGRRVSNKAIDFIDRHRDERFFLVVSYDEPHGPFLCPKKWVDMYRDFEFPVAGNVRDTLGDKPEHQRVWAGRNLAADREAVSIKRPYYFGCNSFVDDEIGRVLAAVDAFAPDALIIYTSDHGDMLESHCLNSKGPAMYEEITRIPLLVRWPGQTPAGSVAPHPVSHIDMVPTILDALGAPSSKILEGRSLLPAFTAPETAVDDVVFMEWGRYEIDHDGFGGYQPIRAACDGRYKLVVNLMVTDELYDLEMDPGEMVNLIASPDHAAIRNRLHDRIVAWMNETRDPFRGYYWQRRPWRTDAPPPNFDFTGMTRQREEDEAYEPRQLDYGTGLPMASGTRAKPPA